MKIIKVVNQQAGGQQGSEIFEAALNNGAKTFGLATGSTPLSTYQHLVASNIDFSKTVTINLDEYVGLAYDHEQSYHYFMQTNLFATKKFAKSFIPDGMNANLEQAIKNYDGILANNPIDLQILGIGENGHIGFNEPGTSFDSHTHIVDLTPSTIKANARFFENITDVPTQAITMGIADIMAAKQIVLLAFGRQKAQAVKAMIEGPITETVPASVLQKHVNVVVIIDDDAASLLR